MTATFDLTGGNDCPRDLGTKWLHKPPDIWASSAEFVGEFWLGKLSECVI